jgi:hypothetical protein
MATGDLYLKNLRQFLELHPDEKIQLALDTGGQSLGPAVQLEQLVRTLEKIVEIATELSGIRDFLPNGHRASDYGHDILLAIETRADPQAVPLCLDPEATIFQGRCVHPEGSHRVGTHWRHQ